MIDDNKIAVVTDFMNFPSHYGLVPVVLAQLRMLVKHGWRPYLFVVEGTEFDDSTVVVPDGVEIVPKLPFIHLYDYQPGSEEQKHDVNPLGETSPRRTNLKKQIDLTYKYLEPELSKFNVVIEHDIIYQTWKIPYNSALRRIAGKNPHIKWLHWCHSAPSERPDELTYPSNLRFTPMNNSTWVTFNEVMREGFALQYNVPIDQVKVVYHYIDEKEFHNFTDLTIDIARKHKLFDADVVCIYPTRFDHYDGKGLAEILWLVAAMNRVCNAKLLYVNSWSGKKEGTIKRLRKEASKWNMPMDNLGFTSEMGKKHENGVPRRVVNELYRIGNMFAQPSTAETFSLILAEAMQTKNHIVYNENLHPTDQIHGFHGTPFPWTSDWGGTRITPNYQPNLEKFYLDKAREIWNEIKNNKVLMAQRRGFKLFNMDWIYENQLKPLLEES